MTASKVEAVKEQRAVDGSSRSIGRCPVISTRARCPPCRKEPLRNLLCISVNFNRLRSERINFEGVAATGFVNRQIFVNVAYRSRASDVCLCQTGCNLIRKLGTKRVAMISLSVRLAGNEKLHYTEQFFTEYRMVIFHGILINLSDRTNALYAMYETAAIKIKSKEEIFKLKV